MKTNENNKYIKQFAIACIVIIAICIYLLIRNPQTTFTSIRVFMSNKAPFTNISFDNTRSTTPKSLKKDGNTIFKSHPTAPYDATVDQCHHASVPRAIHVPKYALVGDSHATMFGNTVKVRGLLFLDNLTSTLPLLRVYSNSSTSISCATLAPDVHYS
jgi:hypothetical protein